MCYREIASTIYVCVIGRLLVICVCYREIPSNKYMCVIGRLLRANDIDFNWYRLSAWINITEQWPYRTSWILLYYEEMEGRLDDSLSLLTIYEM